MTGELNMDNFASNEALNNLAGLQVRRQSLQTEIMTLLAEQRRDLDTMSAMASGLIYTAEETQSEGWRIAFDSLVC